MSLTSGLFCRNVLYSRETLIFYRGGGGGVNAPYDTNCVGDEALVCASFSTLSFLLLLSKSLPNFFKLVFILRMRPCSKELSLFLILI